MSALAEYVAEIGRQLDLLRSAEERDSLALRIVHGFEKPNEGTRRVWTERDKRYVTWQEISKAHRRPVPKRRVGRILSRLRPDNRESRSRALHRLALAEAKQDGTLAVVADALEKMAEVHAELLEHYADGAREIRHQHNFDELLSRWSKAFERVTLYVGPPRGSYAAQRTLAGAEADKLAADAEREPDPALARLFGFIREAFGNATEIAKLSRPHEATNVSQFVGNVVRLLECMERCKAEIVDDLVTHGVEPPPPGLIRGVIDQLLCVTKLYEKWPPDPGIKFSWKSGDSALHVALVFAGMIDAAVGYGRVKAIGGREFESLPAAPEAHPLFAQWRDEVIRKLQDGILESLPAWPMHEIHRDSEALDRKMTAEYRAARAEPVFAAVADDKARRKNLSARERRIARNRWANAEAEAGETWQRIADKSRRKYGKGLRFKSAHAASVAVKRFRIAHKFTPLEPRQRGRPPVKKRSKLSK